MSDDLVKRARHNALSDMPHYASVELIEALADRIEELEAENADLKDKLAKAAKALGVSDRTVSRAVQRGTEDRVALSKERANE